MGNLPIAAAFHELTQPKQLWRAGDLIGDRRPPPTAGVYSWWFDELPPTVPADGTLATGASRLLYCGISPKRPPTNGSPPSKQHLRKRIIYHYTGNAEGSTLRLTLGCLLQEKLNIRLQVVGSGTRMTFADGEDTLTQWMSQHARVAWVEHPEPWLVEEYAIERLTLPLNLDQNRHCAFHPCLSEARQTSKARARAAWVAAHPT